MPLTALNLYIDFCCKVIYLLCVSNEFIRLGAVYSRYIRHLYFALLCNNGSKIIDSSPIYMVLKYLVCTCTELFSVNKWLSF